MKRRIIDLPGQPHFVTFSTYQRRRFLTPKEARNIVQTVLAETLEHHRASCHGYVIMPDHVHVLLTAATDSSVSKVMLAWKKTSSYRLKKYYVEHRKRYLELCPDDCPIWQAHYYDHNLEGDESVNRKLEYIHNNPVEAKLAVTPFDWKWSSSRFYEMGGGC